MVNKRGMKGEYRRELERKAVETLEAHDRIGDQAFDEGREPTKEEWDRMAELNDRYQDYVELIEKFFQPPEELIRLDLPLH